MADYKAIIDRYQNLPGGIIEAYHALQREFNYIPEDAIAYAAGVFDMPKAKAYGVASFYSYFKIGERGQYVFDYRLTSKANYFNNLGVRRGDEQGMFP